MKKEASFRRKTGAVLIAAAVLVSSFAPAVMSFAEAEESQVLDEEQLTVQEPQAPEQTDQEQPEQEEVTVTGIGLNHKSLSLKAGKTAKLKAVVTPSEAADIVTWESSQKTVAVVDENGTITAQGPGTAVISAKAGDKTAKCKVKVTFKAPTKAKAKSLGLTKIQITWNKVSGATGYEVFRAADKKGTYKKIATVKGNSYKDGKRTTGKEYFYKVRARRVHENGNAKSKCSAITSEWARPDKTSVKLQAGEEKVTVSWKKAGNAQGYHIYCKTSKKADYKRIAIVSQSQPASFTHQGLKGGKTYYYKIRTYRMVKGEKVFSYGSKTISTAAKKVKLKTHKSGFQYKRKMIVKAYAYTGGGRTASGTPARKGAIAVDPRVIPLGTKVYVEGYGYASAEDTGGNIKGRTIDLYMNSGSACMRWGVRYKTVYLDVKK